MTDKEIEKDTIEERLARRADEQDDFLANDALEYINRLKDEINAEKRSSEKFGFVYTGMLEFQDKLRSVAVEKAKNDTAKEILQIVYDLCKVRKEIQWDDVYFLLKRYGVEVGDD